MTGGVAILTGVLVVGGLIALLVAVIPATPHLADTIGGLGGGAREDPLAMLNQDADSSLRSERLGAWVYRRTPFPLTERQRQNLQLRGKTIAEFYADKAVLAIVGAVLPGLLGAAWCYAFDLPIMIPAIAALLGALIGSWLPDLLLRGAAKGVRADASEALLTYIDLVTLERLANASATQALHNAAALSDSQLFLQIRAALERARLEQQSPYRELRKLAEQLAIPQLADIADVMQLDESGAALSGALRARVRELRDAHLTRAQFEANAMSEGMTLYMTIPALIFGVIFVVPPMMRILMT